MSDHHHASSVEIANNPDSQADSTADAKSVVALIIIVVMTACFWLIGR